VLGGLVRHTPNFMLDYYLRCCYMDFILAHSGRVLEPYLNAERGVASCGGGSGTVRPGRFGTPPSGHYDPGARSSL